MKKYFFIELLFIFCIINNSKAARLLIETNLNYSTQIKITQKLM